MFVKHKSILFNKFHSCNPFGGWFTYKMTWIDHIGVPFVGERVLNFLQDVSFHNLIVELFTSPVIKGKTTHLNTHLAILGNIPIILCAT